MARYISVWKDNEGGEHPTEKAAREADNRIEIKYQKEKRRQKLIFEFRRYIDGEKLPYFRYFDAYDRHHDSRQSEQNRDSMIDWIIKNEEMIKSVLNG